MCLMNEMSVWLLHKIFGLHKHNLIAFNHCGENKAPKRGTRTQTGWIARGWFPDERRNDGCGQGRTNQYAS